MFHVTNSERCLNKYAVMELSPLPRFSTDLTIENARSILWYLFNAYLIRMGYMNMGDVNGKVK